LTAFRQRHWQVLFLILLEDKKNGGQGHHNTDNKVKLSPY